MIFSYLPHYGASMIDLLEIPDIESISSSIINGRRVIEARTTGERQTCHDCNFKFTMASRAWKTDIFADAPIRCEPVAISLKRPGRCPTCKSTSNLPKFIHPKRKMTMRCHEYISSLALSLPASQIAHFVGVSASTVERISNSQKQALEILYKPYLPRFIGIDEVRVRSQFRCIIVDLEKCLIVDIIYRNDDSSLRKWLSQFSKIELDSVCEVTMDQTDRYRTIFKSMCQNATIVYDKFHFVRLINLAVSNAYRATGWVKSARSKEGAQARALLWSKKSTLGKLDPRGQLILDGMLSNSIILKKAHAVKENFHTILEKQHLSKNQSFQEIDEWVQSIDSELHNHFEKVIRSAHNWRPQIAAMLRTPNTNSKTEGLNRIVKLAAMTTPRASFQQLRLRLILGQKHWSNKNICACCADGPSPGEKLESQFGLNLCPQCARELQKAEGL